MIKFESVGVCNESRIVSRCFYIWAFSYVWDVRKSSQHIFRVPGSPIEFRKVIYGNAHNLRFNSKHRNGGGFDLSKLW